MTLGVQGIQDISIVLGTRLRMKQFDAPSVKEVGETFPDRNILPSLDTKRQMSFVACYPKVTPFPKIYLSHVPQGSEIHSKLSSPSSFPKVPDHIT